MNKLWLALLGVAVLEAEAGLLKHSRHTQLTSKRRDDGDDDDEGDDDDDNTHDDSKNGKLLAETDPSMVNSAPASTTTTSTTTLAPPPPPPPPAAPVSHPWDGLQGKLEVVEARVSQLKAELKTWGDHASWDAKISADKQALAAATTEALADMLADIRTELHQLAVPVYTDVLDENLEALMEKEAMLKQEIAEMKNRAAAPAPIKVQAPPEPPAPAHVTAEADTFLIVAAFIVGVILVLAASAFLTKP